MKYRLNDEKMFLDSAEGATIVIEFTSGSYFGFSSLASVLVDKLAHGVDDRDVLSSVLKLDGCPDSFEKDFTDFCSQLLQKEIIVPGNDDIASEVFEISESALGDGFELKCFENKELQDLIMADPVHDVDPESGWPFMK